MDKNEDADPSEQDGMHVRVAQGHWDTLQDHIEEGNSECIVNIIEKFHEADLADFIEQLETKNRQEFIRLVGNKLNPKILSELEESVRDEVLSEINSEYLSNMVSQLDTDDIVYLVENLDSEQRAHVLHALGVVDRLIVERCLEYPEDYAGRMIQGKMVTAPAFWNVGQLIDVLRSAKRLPNKFYEVVIVDPSYCPIGIVPLYEIISTNRKTVIESIMKKDFISFKVDVKQSEIAYYFNHYHLLSAPIIDETGRLAGVITIDDAMEVLEDETEDDFLRLKGLGNETVSDGILDVAFRRLPWLAVNLLTAIMASTVISLFEEALEKIVALAVLMPIVASMGGNAGTQTLTIVVRAIATKDLTSINIYRVMFREIAVGCINGVFLAFLVGILEYFWFGGVELAFIIGFSVIVNMIFASISGVLVPIGLKKINSDPANGSSVLVTTVTDVIGFLSFLGTATFVLLD